MSILVVPISIDNRFWGFIGFDDCHAQRQWRYEEEAVLVAMAGSIGGAIARSRMEQQLRRTGAELRAVFQSMPDEYFRLGADGSILDYKISEDSTLLNNETFIGQWASGMLPEAIEQQLDVAIEQVKTTKSPVSIEYKLPASTQQKSRYEEIRLLAFLENQLIGVARDMTERKEVVEALRRRCSQLEKQLQEQEAKLTGDHQTPGKMSPSDGKANG